MFLLGDSLGSTDGKLIHAILWNVGVITLGIDVGTELCYLDRPFDVSNDGKLEGLMLGDSLGYTNGKVLGSGEGIKLVYNDGELISTILGDLGGITLGIGVETELFPLDGPFDGSSNGVIEGLLLGDSLGYTNGKVLGSDEGTKLRYTCGEVIGTIVVN